MKALSEPHCIAAHREEAIETPAAAVTIASQLRIQSILSPADPPDADEATTASATTADYEAFPAPRPTADLPTESPHQQGAPAHLPPDRPLNRRQPLPRSPPRAAPGAAPRGHVLAAEDESQFSAGAAMMGGIPVSPPGAIDTKKGAKRPPLRSSIACQRCRKSKIKCNNTGGDAPCETCIRNGKECTYPEATPAPPKRPAGSPPGVKPDGPPDRKRQRKIEDIAKIDNDLPAAHLAEEVLSAPYLSESVWSQVFEIYRLHFASELPFLHLATLKEKISGRFRAKQQTDASPEINLVLLGILTLTARFHPTLVSYVTPLIRGAVLGASTKSRPVGNAEASEYYAEVLTKAIGGLRSSMTIASVERVQAFLMLGLYEWSQSRPRSGGMAAWMYVGVAIRMAQALGLGEGDRNQEKGFKSPRTAATKTSMTQSQMAVAREIRRRTMFSCLILDRLLGCGKGRVSTIRSEDLHIQLPCSEISFDWSEEAYTGFLKPSPEDRVGKSIKDSLLGRFVRLVDLWGEISKWSFAGGRFTEGKNAPWQPETTFYQLRQKLDEFYDDLPERFRLSDLNFYKHENHQASSAYVSMHMLGAVCRIMLHREYIPFIPIRCHKPIGPLDEPIFRPGTEPPGFWDSSAEKVFHAARDIVNLIDLCRDKLPMSALVLFAVWTAAFVGVYAVCFPHMDAKRHMLPAEDEGPIRPDQPKSTSTYLTFKTLQHMSIWLKMAETYVEYFKDMDKYYQYVKQDYERYTWKKTSSGQAEGGKLSVRIGGGGLEEWKQQGLKIVNHGEILPVDDDRSSSRGSTMEPGSSVGPDNSYHPEQTKTPRSTSMSFTPINSHHTQQPDHMDSKMEVLPSDQAPAWLQVSQNMQQSPSQSSYAMPSPQMPQQLSVPELAGIPEIPNIPSYGSAQDMDKYLATTQSFPWYLVPGGINQFAHGSEDLLPEDSGNGFWGSMPETGLVQQYS
ncbi:fungal-specific transcription factor domain-containing protein [Echria macrotheca]|uniref:Fungal-specific transcription factor domain-containing protein n=1 Tax=Echria macrotheca TaxID=438768 RepID=A0AAJ0F3E3_9PEZI|nr:fungal-specific transcription factor domain-containing protein [Echria macrotheca]